MDKFESLWRSLRGPSWIPPERVLTLDPGDTTGWAMLEHGSLAHSGQVAGTTARITELFDLYAPTLVIFEEFVLYPWKSAQQSFSNLPTARLIGAIELLAEQRRIPVLGQGANLAKGVIDDQKLKNLFLYQSGKRHANDAIRHAVYAMCCNKQLPQGQEEEPAL